MFACSECMGTNHRAHTNLMKLTTICDICHVISYTRPSSPLFFCGGTERKACERGYTSSISAYCVTGGLLDVAQYQTFEGPLGSL